MGGRLNGTEMPRPIHEVCKKILNNDNGKGNASRHDDDDLFYIENELMCQEIPLAVGISTLLNPLPYETS